MCDRVINYLVEKLALIMEIELMDSTPLWIIVIKLFKDENEIYLYIVYIFKYWYSYCVGN